MTLELTTIVTLHCASRIRCGLCRRHPDRSDDPRCWRVWTQRRRAQRPSVARTPRSARGTLAKASFVSGSCLTRSSHLNSQTHCRAWYSSLTSTTRTARAALTLMSSRSCSRTCGSSCPSRKRSRTFASATRCGAGASRSRSSASRSTRATQRTRVAPWALRQVSRSRRKTSLRCLTRRSKVRSTARRSCKCSSSSARSSRSRTWKPSSRPTKT